jgi:hypothetical protein
VEQDDNVRHTVRNNQRQPVELHLPSGVLLLLPGETADVSAADLTAPQLQVLRAGRIISAHRSTGSDSDPASGQDGGETATDSDDGSGTAGTPPGDNPKAKRRGASKDRV